MPGHSNEIDSPSLNESIIYQVRKWKLLGNERTTLLSQAEELQIIQYCVATQNKQADGSFHADPKQSWEMQAAMRKFKITQLEKDVEEFLNGEKDLPTEKGNENIENDDSATELDLNAPTNEKQKEKGEREEDNGDYTQKNNDRLRFNIERMVAKELGLEFDFVCSTLKLFHNNLKFSNHITLMDVYQAFVFEYLKKNSKFSREMTSLKSSKISHEEHSELWKLETKIMRLLNTDEHCNSSTNLINVMPLPSSPHLDNAMLSSPKTPRISKKFQNFTSSIDCTPSDLLKAVKFSPTNSDFPCTPLNAKERLEVQKKFIENIFQCYLHLLVNSRCELALAAVFNIPERELTHEAFTHLKHMATNSKLSMYQTLSTFLMRIRLGGQSYAPSTDQPLYVHVKGLGNLFDLLDKMQTVVEEHPQPRSVCRRLLNIMKSNLSSCRSARFPRSMVETVADDIFNVLLRIMENQVQPKEDSEKPISDGGSLNGQRSLMLIRHYLDITATTSSPVDRYMLFDVRFSLDTPTRFPSLLSKFRSPMPTEEEPMDEGDKSNDDCHDKEIAQVQLPRFKASEALFLDGSKDDDLICTPFDSTSITVVPSKTIVQPGTILRDKILKDKLEFASDIPSKSKPSNGNNLKVKTGSKRAKKNVIDGKENPSTGIVDVSPKPKKPTVSERSKPNQKGEDKPASNVKKGKSCRRKLMIQVKGQSKITGFFKA